MPKDPRIKKVLVIGSGPIIIGQAAEFDYSGTQACRALKSEGIETVLVNSNPATIMTDPEMADATYIEPIATPILEQIIAKERPDALLPTLGGQTALNAAMALGEAGVLEKYNVELIGASLEAIDRGEDRELFKKVVDEAGAESARSDIAHSIEEVDKIAEKFGYPLVVRPSFTMGGLGSGIAHNEEELHRIAGAGIHYSPTDEVLIEEGIEGWKEFELELMRDRNDNVVVVCPIENVDPVGVHTGDSIVVAPTQTLADLLTIYREKGGFENLTIGLCGDLKFGRTVHSLIDAMSRYAGVKFVLISPEELKLPRYVKEQYIKNKNIPYIQSTSLDEVMPELDILYMTRVQKERFFNEEEYLRLKDSYVLTPEKLKNAKPDLRILHPLPRVNEISVAVDEDPRACYFKQVQYGKYIRMALILKLLNIA